MPFWQMRKNLNWVIIVRGLVGGRLGAGWEPVGGRLGAGRVTAGGAGVGETFLSTQALDAREEGSASGLIQPTANFEIL